MRTFERLICHARNLLARAGWKGARSTFFPPRPAPRAVDGSLQRVRYDCTVQGCSFESSPGLVDVSRVACASEWDGPEGSIQVSRDRSTPSAAYLTYKAKPILAGRDPVDLSWCGAYRAGGHLIHDLRWTRPAIEHRPVDRRYHAALDVALGPHDTLSFLLQAEDPAWIARAVALLIWSLRVVEPEPSSWVAPARGEPRAVPLGDQAEAWLAELNRGPATWGVYEPGAPRHSESLGELEEAVGFRFPILLVYTRLQGTDDYTDVREELQAARQLGRALELTLHVTPEKGDGSPGDFYRALAGEYDAQLRAYARAVRDHGEPVLFRPNNEMNGDWCNYSAYWASQDAGLYRYFWRHLWQLFQEEGATNALWVWNPHDRAFPDFPYNHGSLYYPGDDVVDLVGMTGYNNGTFFPNEAWRSFDEIYGPLYEEYEALFPDKPFLITEFGSSSQGGDKLAWVRDAFARLPSYPRIRVAVWWNQNDWAGSQKARDYRIDEEQAWRVFKEEFAARRDASAKAGGGFDDSSPLPRNRIHPGKLLGSKWTAVTPTDQEKHFVVKRLLPASGPPQSVVLEAIHSGREFELPWRELTDARVWRIGWK